MGSGMFLGLCHGEVECGDTIQELVASVELETGSASAEVGGECFEAITISKRIRDIELDWKLHGHSYGLTQIVIFLSVWCEGAGGRRLVPRLSCKQNFKAER